MRPREKEPQRRGSEANHGAVGGRLELGLGQMAEHLRAHVCDDQALAPETGAAGVFDSENASPEPTNVTWAEGILPGFSRALGALTGRSAAA
jgi:hypothetical protein